jgi:hypothetical protein
MRYFYTKYGTIINENYQVVPMIEGNHLYEEYLLFLKADGTVESSDYVTDEEIQELQKSLVPTEVALWKLRFVLSKMQLEQSVTEAINLLEEPQRKAATYIWNFGTAVDRYSNTVIFIKTALGLTEQEVDDIFIQANSVQL